ncbi:hybrid sensor histidine kinase/response regulator [Mucilaginibacter arboris]|uniref:histidine kinase n=1 Tax=Mucilaginibacter arboris TaxID=2682090 RepID=A0A7K1T0E6_9SPHI|nr:ATP-binding protein [Mucilaginibacter arboris]MVN23035.1 PAS domain S-box protein [Mucilaginibacter arboris]
MPAIPTYDELLGQNQELQRQLEEASDAIEAIRTGQVDALIVKANGGHELYTLRSADQTYRVFIEKMAEGAVTLDHKGTVLYSNSRFASMIGLPLEKVIGTPFETFVPETFKEVYNELIRAGWAIETKGEINLVNFYNHHIPFLLSINALPLNEEASLSIILTDLTSQKRTEQQLKFKNEQLEEARQIAESANDELEDIVKERTRDLMISQEHFKFLADNIPVMVWTARPDGLIDYYNQRWYEYTGFNFEQSKDWGWKSSIHPDDLENSIDTWKKSFESGELYEMQFRLKCAEDGQYRWHLGHAVPYKDESGKVIKWFGTNTDIEDQKKEMEKRDEFIGIASHELKTPLTSAKGYIQLIDSFQKEVLPVTVKTFVKKANESLNKLQILVNDLLDVSKIQAGKLEFSVTRINLSQLIVTCVENVAHIYPSAVIINCYTGDFMLNGNFERLEQVLMNLISNAVKYSNTDHPIDINAVQVDNYVRVSVTDAGIGLSETEMERIFERFYRVEDKKFLTSGLGMGLYISSEIVKAHHGFMTVESKLNEGSTFSFNLPL